MIEGTAGRHWSLPPVAHSASTPSPLTSRATGTSARSLRRGGRSRQRDGELGPAAPPTASEGPPDGVGRSVPQGLLTVKSCIKVRLDLQVDKSPVVVKRPFFP
jgi:hypothetical protein